MYQVIKNIESLPQYSNLYPPIPYVIITLCITPIYYINLTRPCCCVCFKLFYESARRDKKLKCTDCFLLNQIFTISNVLPSLLMIQDSIWCDLPSIWVMISYSEELLAMNSLRFFLSKIVYLWFFLLKDICNVCRLLNFQFLF